jgi:hypothetical protein
MAAAIDSLEKGIDRSYRDVQKTLAKAPDPEAAAKV